MGILNFLKFTLLLIDFLAWPVFALVYPLCASIRAIESGSKYHMRKLVIYWTLFSLISLFELAFIKLIEWIPLWSFIKFIAICWLVIPRFHGACYVYQRLVNPCSSVNVRALVSRLCKPNEEQRLTTETLVAVTERYIKENGSEAFENLMKSKISNTLHLKCKEPDNVQKDIQQLESKDKIDAATIEQPKCKEPEVAEKDINALEPPEKIGSTTEEKRADAKIPEKILREEAYDRLPEVPVKKVQREWACALCQVTTSSEQNLNSHLQGSKHKSKWDELNRNKQDMKTRGSSPSVTHKSKDKIDAAIIEQPKCKEPDAAEKDINALKPPEKIASTTEEQRAESDAKILEQMLREEAYDRLPEEHVKKVQREWACALCQVTTSSESNLNSHLQGSKHKSKWDELNRNKQDTKTRGSSPSVTHKSKRQDHEPEKGNIGEESKQNHAKSDPKRQEQTTLHSAGSSQRSEPWCDICKVMMPGETQLVAHLQGRKHSKNIQKWIDEKSSTLA